MSTSHDLTASAPVAGDHPEPHLRRVLGLPSLVFFGLAYMVPLTVWTTYGVVTTTTEGHLPAAYVVTTTAMLLTAYSYGRIGGCPPPRARPTPTPPTPSAGRSASWSAGAAARLHLPADDQLPGHRALPGGLLPQRPELGLDRGQRAPRHGAEHPGDQAPGHDNLVLVVVQFVFIAVFIALSLGRLLRDQEVQSFTAPFYEPGMETGLIFAGAAVLALSFLGFDAVSTSRRRRASRAGGSWRSSSAPCWAACSTSSSPTWGTWCSPTTSRSPTARTSPAPTS